MKAVFYPPGFTLINNDLEIIIATLNQAEKQIHEAAKKLAEKILPLFSEGLSKKLLKTNAFENVVEFENKKLFPEKTFLETVFIKAINDSQKRSSFSTGFVFVDSTELQNIGLSTSLESKEETESKLEKACAEIIRVTNTFVIPGFMQWRTDKNSEFAEFYVNCEFMKTVPLFEIR